MKNNSMKRILGILMLIILCAVSLCACKKYKIDVGGKDYGDKPLAVTVARMKMEDNDFSRDDNVNIAIGWAFRASSFRGFGAEKPICFSIKCEGFTVFDGEDVFQDEYNKSITGYLDDNTYLAVKKGRRYQPQNYETYTFHLRSSNEEVHGRITVSVIIDYGEGVSAGDAVSVFYAANEEEIAFSGKSVEDAKKKLK